MNAEKWMVFSGLIGLVVMMLLGTYMVMNFISKGQEIPEAFPTTHNHLGSLSIVVLLTAYALSQIKLSKTLKNAIALAGIFGQWAMPLSVFEVMNGMTSLSTVDMIAQIAIILSVLVTAILYLGKK
jgi:hypothetical protein